MLKINNNRIVLARALNGMTIRDLSIKSGVAISTINKIEKGYTNPNPVTIGKIAKTLNVNVEDLLISNSYGKEG